MLDDRPRYEPWLSIPAADYEGHMSSPGVGQLQALNRALAAALGRARPARLLVVGCTTGNGLEHVDRRVTRRVVGLDVNPDYLEVARARFSETCPGLDLVCADAESHDFEPGSFDLVFAGLILEYVRPEALLRRVAVWLSDGGCCCVVIQLPDERLGPVSETGFRSLRTLAPTMKLLTAGELRRIAARAGLMVRVEREIPLPNGKRLLAAYLHRSVPVGG